MDKAVIIGVFEFLGFHFCQKLLNMGVEVNGLHIGGLEEGLFLDEKRMEIGRNANFREYALGDYQWTKDEQGETIIIVDYYDLFIRREAELFALQPIKSFLTHLKSSKNTAVFLLPIQLLLEEGFEKEKTTVNRFFRLLRRTNGKIKKIYLPTVYGPWQPQELSFQQHFLRGNSDNRTVSINDREWLLDAVYIKDIVQTVLHNSREGGTDFIISSGKTNQWESCAQYLSIPTKEKSNGKLDNKSQELFISIKETTPIQTALKTQQNHTEWLKSLE